MNIVITADPYIPVPPTHYGGIERVIDFLARGLVARGHEVTLVAHPESRTAGTLVPYGSGAHWSRRERMAELMQVAGALWRRRARTDVIHSFGRLAALVPILPARGVAKVQSYQRALIPWRSVRMAERLAGPTIAFTACGSHMWTDEPQATPGRWRTIFNGVERQRLPFVGQVAADAPLVFLGRLDRIKGAHHAIAVARATGRALILAGPRATEGEDAEYFAREIAPALDGGQIRWVGPVDDVAKAELLGRAAALLMLVEWAEPFGIVMAEALACGTPVIGFARGSVPEVIRDGVTGFLVPTLDAAVAAVDALPRLSRAEARADFERRFGDNVIVDAYESLYRELVERRAS